MYGRKASSSSAQAWSERSIVGLSPVYKSCAVNFRIDAFQVTPWPSKSINDTRWRLFVRCKVLNVSDSSSYFLRTLAFWAENERPVDDTGGFNETGCAMVFDDSI